MLMRRAAAAAATRRAPFFVQARTVLRAGTSDIITPFRLQVLPQAAALGQALISLWPVSPVLISTLRGLAFSAIGMVRVSTPAS